MQEGLIFQNRQNAFEVVGLFDEHFPEQGRQLGAIVVFLNHRHLLRLWLGGVLFLHGIRLTSEFC